MTQIHRAKVEMWFVALCCLFDPSRRQQANFLRKKLEGEKFEKSESEEV